MVLSAVITIVNYNSKTFMVQVTDWYKLESKCFCNCSNYTLKYLSLTISVSILLGSVIVIEEHKLLDTIAGKKMSKAATDV